MLPRMVSFNSGLSASMAMVAYYPRLCGIFGFPLLLLLMAPRSRKLEMMSKFTMFFFGGVWGTKKWRTTRTGFFCCIEILGEEMCIGEYNMVFFWRSRLNSTRIYSIKPFPFFLASGMTRVQYHQIIVLLVH